MLFSQRCDYGLRAALYLASRADKALVPVREVSETLGIPHAFLAKTVRDLVAVGILRTQPGARGGIALDRPADEVTLEDIVLAIDGPDLFRVCVLRLPGCGELDPCPVHEVWMPMRERIVEMLRSATLGATAEATRAHGFRLGAPGAAEE